MADVGRGKTDTYRKSIPKPRRTHRPIFRIPSPIAASSRTARRPARPLQIPITELHVVILMLAHDDQGYGEFACEG